MQAVAPLGQQAPLPSAPKQVPIEAHVVPLPTKVLRPKLVVTRPQPEMMVIEQVPVVEQQAPVTQGLAAQVVPTPAKSWLTTAPQPAIVLMEQTPAVVQHEPVSDGHGPGHETPSP